MTRTTLLLIGAAVAATLLLLALTAGARPWQSVAAVVMLSTLPYVAFTALARWARGLLVAEASVLGGLVLALFFAVGVYALAFWLDPGPRSAQAVVMVPLVQSGAVALAGAGVAFAKWQSMR
jgi:hypothetical protein